jgi:hypothetical protein
LTPSLELFAGVGTACVNVKAGKGGAEKVLTLLAYAKAAGYELDTIATTSCGRELIAAGVIAAGMLDNIALGLRLFTAAGKAGCAPRGAGEVKVSIYCNNKPQLPVLLD